MTSVRARSDEGRQSGSRDASLRLGRSERHELQRQLEDLVGLSLSGNRLDQVAQFVASRVASTDHHATEWIERLRLSSMQVDLDRIVGIATNQETSFFRGARQLEVLDSEVLHPLLAQRSSATVRLWSAACSTGEEALTLAMMVADRVSRNTAFGREWSSADVPHVEIVASDVCRQTVEVAASGRYSMVALQRLGRVKAERYFDVDGSALVADWKTMPPIEHHVHNLLRRGSFGEFDVILIRNVLFYLSDRARSKVLRNMERSLRPGGVLVLGANDGASLSEPYRSIGAHCYVWGDPR